MPDSTLKERLRRVVELMPDDVSLDEAIYRLDLICKIEKACAQADAGQFITHEEVKQRMRDRGWLS